MNSRLATILHGSRLFHLFLVCIFTSQPVYSEQILNQDADIPSGSTLSHATAPIQQLTGGPYTINNEGTIEATDVSSHGNAIQLEVGTTINNSGLIDSVGSANTNTINFINNTGTDAINNIITNSGTIRTETSGRFGQAISVQESNITSITNRSEGMIQVSDSAASSSSIRVDTGGNVDLISNEGIISSSGSLDVNGIVSINTGNIEQIINTGTITAQGGSGTKRGIVFWNSGTSVNNSGTIQGISSTGSGHGIRVGGDGVLDTLTNSGTITGSNHGIANTGMINHLINTGTITGTSGYDIYNAGGVITHLTNAQSELTIQWDVPTNYFILTESISSYGKVAFTNATGTMNFAVAEDSDLTEGTYEAVVIGINADHLATHAGAHISNGTHYTYHLNNPSGTQWDLVVNDLTSPTQCSINASHANCTNTQSVSSTIERGLNAVNTGNFAFLNTYDCDTFGPSGQCISLGGRYTSINDPQSDMYGLVFTYGKKQSAHFRWGGFIHSNVSYEKSSDLSLTQKFPMVGAYAVWNQKPDQTGLQVKIGNAYQATNAKITRPQVGVSEQGSGHTTITGNMLAMEVRNHIPLTKAFTLSPFIAARYSHKQQNSYTETHVDLPLSFNQINDRSWTAIGGLKFHKTLHDTNSLYGTLGLEYDISHSVSDLSPEGISGISTVDLEKNHQSTRPVISLGYDHQVTRDQIFRIKAQYEELPYQDMNETNIYVSYQFLF